MGDIEHGTGIKATAELQEEKFIEKKFEINLKQLGTTPISLSKNYGIIERDVRGDNRHYQRARSLAVDMAKDMKKEMSKLRQSPELIKNREKYLIDMNHLLFQQVNNLRKFEKIGQDELVNVILYNMGRGAGQEKLYGDLEEVEKNVERLRLSQTAISRSSKSKYNPNYIALKNLPKKEWETVEQKNEENSSEDEVKETQKPSMPPDLTIGKIRN